MANVWNDGHRWRAVSAVAVVSLALAGCGGTKVWMKSGAASIDAENDEMDCTASSENSSSVTFSSDGGASGMPPVDQFSKRYGCLRSRGYKLISLSDEESKQLKGLTGAAREAYWEELMAKHGLQPPQTRPAEPVPAATQQPAARKGDGSPPPGVGSGSSAGSPPPGVEVRTR